MLENHLGNIDPLDGFDSRDHFAGFGCVGHFQQDESVGRADVVMQPKPRADLSAELREDFLHDRRMPFTVTMCTPTMICLSMPSSWF